MKKTLLCLIIGLTLNAAYGDFDKGLAAHENGDYATALKEFKESADKGYAKAQNNLGVMYENGDGVPKNAQEALKWYTLTANQGHVRAQYSLGVMYEDGDGVPKNAQEALKWHTLAVNQGDAYAQYSLGVMYRNGEGVPKNKVLAYALFNLSAEQGVDLAKENRDNIESDLTSDQLTEAQEISTNWKIGTPFPTKTKH